MTVFLRTKTGDPIPLESGSRYVFGRGRECDVILRDDTCSRQHCAIQVHPKGLWTRIEDLGSRNGTWVGKTRVTLPVMLEDGATIQIGCTMFSFHERLDDARTHRPTDEILVTAAVPTLAEESGALGDHGDAKSRGGELCGWLSTIELPDIVQLMHHGARSGRLRLEFADGPGRLEFRKGEILDAEFGRRRGRDAVLAMGVEGIGRFFLEECEGEVERTVSTSTGALLLDMCKARDDVVNLGEELV